MICKLIQLWESSRVHVRNFSKTMEQKPEKNLTRKEERKLRFTYINPSLKPTLLSAKRGHPT